MRWTVTASRHVLRDRWISVRADDCVTASGASVAPFYVLEYPDWVHVVALDCQDHLILVRQYRHGFGAETIELPGGMMDATDEGPLEAGMRELREETGYVGHGRVVASLSPNPATHSNRLHVILATNVEWREKPSLDESENVKVERVPLAEACQQALSGEFSHASHVGLLFLALYAAGKSVNTAR